LPCIFIKKSESRFPIIAVYVDDLNQFEMKDLGKTKFCLGLQIKHFQNRILVYQSTYIEKVLKHFYMEKAHPLSTPMVVHHLMWKKDHFHPQEDD